MLPDIRPGNTKILYFFNCLLDGMHTTPSPIFVTLVTNIGDGISLWVSVPLRKSGFLSSYSKKTPTSKVGDELRLLPA